MLYPSWSGKQEAAKKQSQIRGLQNIVLLETELYHGFWGGWEDTTQERAWCPPRAAAQMQLCSSEKSHSRLHPYANQEARIPLHSPLHRSAHFCQKMFLNSEVTHRLQLWKQSKDREFIPMLITIGRNYPNESKVNPFQQTLELSSRIIELLWILYIIPERMRT